MYENSPISYINKPIDLNTTGLTQKYEFNNIAKGKHSIEVKIISESQSSHSFNGEYKIAIYDSQSHLVKEFFSATNLDKDWYRIHITKNWSDKSHTNYYKFGEVELNSLGSFVINFENIKGLSSIGKGVYEIGIYPFEHNYNIQKRKAKLDTFIRMIPFLIVLILSIIGIFHFTQLSKLKREK